MKRFDTDLFRTIIEGALATFNESHPDRTVPKDVWRSISKRASRILMREFRRRFGDPQDRLVSEAMERRKRHATSPVEKAALPRNA